MREPSMGRPYELPDGQVGRVERCRACGAEIIILAAGRALKRVPRAVDLDGEPHRYTCADVEP